MKKEKKRRGYLEATPKCQFVGAREGDYNGPTAAVSYDDTWLHINTDDYEGNAMLNIEALPFLRRALANIAREIREKKARQ